MAEPKYIEDHLENALFRGAIRVDPVMAADKLFAAEMTPPQEEIVRSVFTNRVTVVVAGHGVGKTFVESILPQLWLPSHAPESCALLIAPNDDDIEKKYFPKIKTQIRSAKAPFKFRAEPGMSKWIINDRLSCIGMTGDPKNVEKLTGFHTEGGTLTIFEEASFLLEYVYKIIRSLWTGANDAALFIGNVNQTAGPFFDLITSGDSSVNVISISSYESPNVIWELITNALLFDPELEGDDLFEAVYGLIPEGAHEHLPQDRFRRTFDFTLARMADDLKRLGPSAAFKNRPEVLPGLTTLKWINETLRECFNDPGHPDFLIRVMGVPPTIGKGELISKAMLKKASDRPEPLRRGKRIMGGDIAYVRDEFTLYLRDDLAFIDRYFKRGVKRSEIIGTIKMKLIQWQVDEFYLDDSALAGIVTELNDEGYNNVFAFTPGGRANDPLRFENARAEALWRFSRWLIDFGHVPGYMLHELKAEAGIKMIFSRKGRQMAESKDDFKKRIGRSPDHIDGASYTFGKNAGTPLFPPVGEIHRYEDTPIVEKIGDAWKLRPFYTPNPPVAGRLFRSAWFNPTGKCAAVWGHVDAESCWTIFASFQSHRQIALREFMREVYVRSFDWAGTAHDYEWDSISAPADAMHMRDGHNFIRVVREEFDNLDAERGKRTDSPRFYPPEKLDGMAGFEPLARLILGTLALDPGNDYWIGKESEIEQYRDGGIIVIHPRDVLTDLASARAKPASGGASELADPSSDSIGGGGPATRCLRMVADQFSAELVS